MERQKDIAVLPGGFVEAAATTSQYEYFYTEKIPYYLHMATAHGYRLNIVVVYGGSDFYRHATVFHATRVRIASRGFPAALATPTNLCGADRIAVRVFHVEDQHLSLDSINTSIQAQYELDRVALGTLRHHVKPLRILAKL
jgi:hypothetical protein